MSGWVTNAICKRRRGLYAVRDGAPVVVAQLRSEFAQMDFAAVYQAAYPGVLAIGGTWADEGIPVTLSDGDLTATFAVGPPFGAARIPVDVGSNGPAFCFECEFTQIAGIAIGFVSTFLFAYNPDAAFGAGNLGTSQFLGSDGLFYGFGGGPAIPPPVAGDVVGAVIDTGGSNTIQLFLNGVPVGGVIGVGAAGNPYFACIASY